MGSERDKLVYVALCIDYIINAWNTDWAVKSMSHILNGNPQKCNHMKSKEFDLLKAFATVNSSR